MVYTGTYTDGIVAGRGWLSIALAFFGGWRPQYILVGAAFFAGMEVLALRGAGGGSGGALSVRLDAAIRRDPAGDGFRNAVGAHPDVSETQLRPREQNGSLSQPGLEPHERWPDMAVSMKTSQRSCQYLPANRGGILSWM